MLNFFKKLGRFLKRWGAWILAGVATVATIVFFLKVKRSDDTVIEKHRADIAKAEADIAFLKGYKESLKGRGTAVEAEIAKVDKALANLETKKKLRAEEIKRMSTKEKLQRLKELGY